MDERLTLESEAGLLTIVPGQRGGKETVKGLELQPNIQASSRQENFLPQLSPAHTLEESAFCFFWGDSNQEGE